MVGSLVVTTDKKFERVDTKFDHLEELVETLANATAQGFDEVNERIDGFEERVDERFEKLESRFDGLQRAVDAGFERTGSLEARVSKLERSV